MRLAQILKMYFRSKSGSPGIMTQLPEVVGPVGGVVRSKQLPKKN
jgi:hypothetical protein